jgi:hypothetical protein
MLWGGIIAAAQVADALQNAIPFAARFRGTNALSATLDALFIDCQMEWEEIYTGALAESEITRRRHKVMMLRHAADLKNLPNGLPMRKSIFKLAEADADAYFRSLFPVESA